jgi:hypothetical protein
MKKKFLTSNRESSALFLFCPRNRDLTALKPGLTAINGPPPPPPPPGPRGPAGGPPPPPPTSPHCHRERKDWYMFGLHGLLILKLARWRVIWCLWQFRQYITNKSFYITSSVRTANNFRFMYSQISTKYLQKRL